MPHIIVEHSNNLSIKIGPFLGALHESLAAHDSVDIRRLKTRAISFEQCVVGDEDAADEMCHITLKVLPRSPDILKTMTKNLHDIATAHISAAHPACKITVEAQQLDPESYCP